MAVTKAVSTHKPNTLASAWLLLSSFVVAWDIGYILLRPRSMKGGDLHWIWAPYAIYMDVDYIYGLPSWNTNDGFPAAQSLMNVGESFLNLLYIYLAHVRATESSLAFAPVWGLISVTMTLSKTILYVLNDYCCSWCKTGHNDLKTLLVYWILPNGLWILFPAIIAVYFIKEISGNLQVAAGIKGAKQVNGEEENTGINQSPRDSAAVSDPNNPFLVDHSQLPAWSQDNAWIIRGYRRPGGVAETEAGKTYEHNTVYKCWKSVWAYWHNETINIHTHLWGAIFSVGLTSLHVLQHLNLLPLVFQRVSHHRFFYPPSLTFITESGRVLRLASASYPSQPHSTRHTSLSHQLNSAAPAPFSLAGLTAHKVVSFFSSQSSSPSSSSLKSNTSTWPNVLSIRPPDTIDVAAFGVFFFASLVCLGFSATYHTIQCHSFRVSKQFNKLDYIGIIVMIVGSFLPALHYGFYCHPHFQIAYSVAIIIMGTFAMYTVLAPHYSTPKYRPYRTAVFLVLGLSAIVPVAHAISVYGYRTITETMGLRFLILSGALYVLGALLYAARIPERFAPGRFDLFGASHQIFHFLILAAAAAHYVSLRRAYAFWHTVETLGDTGTQGLCAVLEAR